MPRIEPLHSNLVVKEHALGEVSKGGILLPAKGLESKPYRYATVIAVGPGRYAADGRLIPCSSKPGDIIAFAKSQGVEFPLDMPDEETGEIKETTLKLLNEQYVLGIMHDLPVVSRLSGLDGRLLMMQPGSQARSDGAYEQLESIARARREGIVDSSGTTLDDMDAMDTAEAEAD